MFPLRQEQLELSADQRLLFINCEKFQTARNLETMRLYERTNLSVASLTSNVLTIRDQRCYLTFFWKEGLQNVLEDCKGGGVDFWIFLVFQFPTSEFGLVGKRIIRPE
jgi:hypothetical protein